MTRINLVDPSELYDQHLIAEYREIRLLVANLRRIAASRTGFDKQRIPRHFTLNRGHVLFFMDKGKYIAKRYQLLRQEMLKRGFNPLFDRIDITVWPPGYFNDWTPTPADLSVIRERIKQKVEKRPHWYRRTTC